MSIQPPAPINANPADQVVRAITDDGCFRVIAARTTQTVRGAIGAQKAHGPTAKHFGDLITGAVLIREAMAPKLRVQAILKPKSRTGSLVADSHPDGTSRGLVSFGGGSGELAGPGAQLSIDGGLLQVMRTLPSGALHQGIVEIPPNKGISGGLMAYMQDSEQIVTMIGVSTLLENDDVIAGGYLLQLLPEIERGPLMVMTERLVEFEKLDDVLRSPHGTPDGILKELLYGMPYTRLDDSPLDFACHCSQVRVVSSLASLPRADIEDLIRDGEVLEIKCDYCGKEYRVPPAQLRSLLTPS